MAEEPEIGIPTEHMTLTRPGLIIPPLSMPIPPRTTIDDLRVRLYTLTAPVRFTGADFERYWPYITNLWTRQYKGNMDPYGVRLELWHCKNSHATMRPPAVRERRGEGIRHRPLKDIPSNCGMKMRLVFYYTAEKDEDDIPDWVLMSNDQKSSGVHQHHSLDDLDRVKRCKKFMDICHKKTTEGYSAPAIARWFRRAYAGQDWCKYIGRMDVKNAGQLWRAKHREVVMKTEVEDDEPMPDDVEGPTWLESVIDEAPHQQVKDAMKKICIEVPAAQDTLLPILMKWDPDERSPTPLEEVHGGVFQDAEGNVRVVQPRPRRDLVQRAPSMVFTEPPAKEHVYISQNSSMQQAYPPSQTVEGPTVYPPNQVVEGPTVYPPSQTVEGPTVYPPPNRPLNIIQHSGRSPPPNHQAVYGQPAQSQIPQNAGGGIPGRPPKQPKVYSTELRALQPAPAKANEEPARPVLHVNSVNPSVVTSQNSPTASVVGQHTQSLFTARPRWAK